MRQAITLLLLMFTAANVLAQNEVEIRNEETMLFNSSWRNMETGDWIISLFNDHAIYNNKVWRYDSKSEKKVVLVNGNEKKSITIGKEKDCKRLFNIDGNKQTLSSITATSITDYPVVDNTSFSIELKEGDALVCGWLRYPKEILNEYMVVEASHSNVATDDYTHYSTQTDSLGRFELNIPLVGTQEVHLHILTGRNETVDVVGVCAPCKRKLSESYKLDDENLPEFKKKLAKLEE